MIPTSLLFRPHISPSPSPTRLLSLHHAVSLQLDNALKNSTLARSISQLYFVPVPAGVHVSTRLVSQPCCNTPHKVFLLSFFSEHVPHTFVRYHTAVVKSVTQHTYRHTKAPRSIIPARHGQRHGIKCKGFYTASSQIPSQLLMCIVAAHVSTYKAVRILRVWLYYESSPTRTCRVVMRACLCAVPGSRPVGSTRHKATPCPPALVQLP